ncbi:RagB/SusD family nutrient uptake outer membrane protein [Terrimonas pollutisoli]|uniref:RagB/SusD family nutrient uptake outer membrane protein n=1 Tax=Terrimonas pollutisoli TaxID=3034147 RepID=UPI0023EC4862|nr:RagB/SusD family nutrient uptake outer membrane protein [Terrimonas sp. H1YJ31]
MKNILQFFVVTVLAFLSFCCKKDDLLDTEPQTIFTDEQIWKDPKLINSVLANLYDRIPKYASLAAGPENFTIFDEGMWSGLNNNDLEARNNLINYGFDRWRIWDYSYIRDVNVAIDNITQSSSIELTPALKSQYIAELRFLRALDYFEMVKRMGGVPIVTKQLIYDGKGDPTPLQQPRNKEEEVYDFIASEVDAIKDALGNAGSKRRANKFTALALKSRAMLYAGSIAKYNNEPGFTNSSLPGGEVGISVSKASEYYQKSLDASIEIINNGGYSLYKTNPNPGENFYDAIVNKNGNTEVIMATDYLKAQGRRHTFTFNNIPRSLFEEAGQGSSNISPSLNLVESFEYLDGTAGTLKGVGTGSNTAAGQANWIFYSNPQDIFADKDARLYGTVMYPGSSFAGKPLKMQTGVYVWNATANKYDRVEGALNSNYTDGKTLTGLDGPHRTTTFVSNTGFYMRKYIDATPGASTLAAQSDTWWVLFRLGEIYLNAAEAAFELGLSSDALNYINKIRERAGFPANSLFSLTIQKIQNERRVELAFEDHRLWDVIRWRIADKIWDGTTTNTDANIYALYPYRIVRPGHPDDGKYVFDKIVAPRFKVPRFFRPGNYYSSIAQNVLDNNSKIIPNPFH